MDGLVGGDALADAPRQQGDAHAGDDHFYLQIPVVALADDLGMGHNVLVERVYVRIEGKGRRIVYEGLVFDVVEGQLAGLRQPVVGRHDDFQRFPVENEEIVGHFRRNRQGDEADLHEAVVDGRDDVQ